MYQSALNSVAYHSVNFPSSWVCTFVGAYLLQDAHWLTLALGFRLSFSLLHEFFHSLWTSNNLKNHKVSQITQTHLVPLLVFHVLTTHQSKQVMYPNPPSVGWRNTFCPLQCTMRLVSTERE